MRKKAMLFAMAFIVVIILVGGLIFYGMKSDKENGSNVASDLNYYGHGGTFKNPLMEMDGPDPSVVYKDGYYYMTFTHHGADVMVAKSRTLDFYESERKVVWYPPLGTMYSANLWAPEIQYLQGKWYIYFAADNGSNENHRMYVLEADSDDPLGDYTFKGQVTDETNKWAIDGLVMEHEEKLYFIWSGWEGDVNHQQNNYIAPMSDPLTISGPRVLLSEPDLEWEKRGGPPYINEGEAILKKDGRTFLIYSGAGSWTPFYSIGALMLNPGLDPLVASNWEKLKKPLMEMDAEAGVYGPGHNSFVASPDGTEDWIVYHATSGISDGWNNRKPRAQKVVWTDEGYPVFGSPLSLDTAIVVPKGEGVFLAKHAEHDGQWLTFDLIPSTTGGNVPLLIQYVNVSGGKQLTDIIVNGELATSVELPQTKHDDIGYVYADIPFQYGMNTISLKTEQNEFVIKAIEMTRFEAELAQGLEHGSAEEHALSSGRGYVRILAGDGEVLRFSNVSVPISGKYLLRLHISNWADDNVQLDLRINEQKDSMTVTIPPTGDRSSYTTIQLEVELTKGPNEITLLNATGRLNLDYIDMTH